ncbi:VanW family protein [Corynebacterium felinum]|uniref:Vancomycin resistance protein YoaR n=1 Tax=Corynebacterium felinum TaxID=131318 RepID=A0ABU2B5V0_9CORY|nr:VanW family protein [Corynebacterium felinum]MDF5821729.1 VanW family protein [Corynebacterium felinum]MDR7353980.1 vancomycin resistance protein YoaR [Corynebacterium felinum]
MKSAKKPVQVKKKSKAGVVVGGFFFGLLFLGGVAYGADMALSQGTLPRGTTVGGVDIGGLSREDATARLESSLDSKLSREVKVLAGEMEASFDPQVAGLSADWAKTLDGVDAQSWNPFVRIMSFVKKTEIPIVSHIDQAKLDPELDRLTQVLGREAVNGVVFLHEGAVKVEPEPLNGQVVDRSHLATSVTSEWLHPQGVTVDASIITPEYDAAKVKQLVDGVAKQAVSGPVILHGRDHVDGVIPPERMGEVVTFIPENGQFRTDINHEAAKNILLEALHSTEVPRANATINFSGASRQVIPHRDGVRIDWEKTFEGINERIIGTEAREFEALYIDDPATFTTEMAEVATFDQLVSEFSTGGYSAASGVNIARVAQMVNGAIVAPGEVFSLNGYTGPRGTAQGFVESGIILNGRADKAVGGGISQFATTLYNAAYFAGFDDVAHQAHSYYISRYPAGREATVFEGSIDLKFRNNSPYPVRIVTSAGGGTVTVQFYGVKTVQVESVNGGRWAPTQPKTVTVPGPGCSPSSGAPGFTTSDTRIIRDLNGVELSRSTQTTVYDPSPIVRCG